MIEDSQVLLEDQDQVDFLVAQDQGEPRDLVDHQDVKELPVHLELMVLGAQLDLLDPEDCRVMEHDIGGIIEICIAC